MLGLGRRLRARNSLWDLVNKHHHHYTSAEPLPQGALSNNGEVDDLPPLPTTPRPPTYHSPSSSSISDIEEAPAAPESPIMAPVRSFKAPISFS